MRKSILTAIGLSTVAVAMAIASTSVEGAVKAVRGEAISLAKPKIFPRRAQVAGFSLPLFFEPTQSQFSNSILLDANKDGKTWTLMSGFIKYGYSSSLAADEWLFIPIQLTREENSLKVSAEYKAQASYDKEAFEICFGREATPEAMTTRCIEVLDFSNTQYKEVENICTISGAGVVYMGIHAKSDVYQSGIYVRNVSVADFSTPVPLAPIIESSSIDGLDYKATVKLPSATKQGKNIEGKVGLSVAVDGVEVKDIADCEPGSTQGVDLRLVKGSHQISYTAYLLDGADKSLGEAVSETVKAVSNDPVNLPFVSRPDADDWESFKVVDANKDGTTWDYDTYENCMSYSANKNAADDWVFLPVINFGDKAGAFDFSLEAKVASEYYPESFEVAVGRSADPSNMTTMMSEIDIKNRFFEVYSGKLSIPEGGNWYVGIHCISAPDQWNLYIRNISITAAADITPAVPVEKKVDFNGLDGVITYTLPEKTVEGKAITTPVGLIVTVDGAEYSRVKPTAAGTDVDVPFTLAVGNHNITAAAFVTDGDSELVGSPVVTKVLVKNPEGYTYSLPFEMRPTLGEFETLTTLDANNSGLEWAYNSGADNGKGAVMMRTTDNKTSDAWIIFPPVKVEDISRIYTVSADVRAYLEQFPEDFDICVGREAKPEAMNVVVSQRGYNNYLYNTLSGEFVADAPGTYVIALHRVSDGSAHTLSFCNVRMYDSGNSASAPMAAGNLMAESDKDGALKATVTMTLPTKGISGNDLEPTGELTATVTSRAGKSASVNGLPGATVSVDVEAVEGLNEFTVVVSSPVHGQGRPATVTAYCGYDVPQAPTVTATVSEDNMTLTLTWVEAERGENGGAVDKTSLSHRIYEPIDEYGEYWNLVAEVPAGVNSYTYTASGIQSYTILGVASENTKGMSSLGLAYEVTGAPYPLPVAEDFTTGRVLYQPLFTPTPTDEYTGCMFGETQQLFPDVENMPLAVFFINTAEIGAKHSRLSMPKFSTVKAKKVRLTMSVFGTQVAPSASVWANIYGRSDIKIADIDTKGSDAWKDIVVELPAELLDKEWVNLYIEVDFNGGSEVLILKSYEIKNVYDKQLSVTLSVPETLTIGDAATITGRVVNRSETPLTLPEVKCTFGEIALVSDTKAPETIGKDETVRYTYAVVPTADEEGLAYITFELADFTDEVNDDNKAEFEVAITPGNKPIVLDLNGEAPDGGGLLLTWTTPEIRKVGEEDVESYEPFDYSEKLGVWTNRDGDGKYVYGFQGVTYPGAYEPKSFQVINTDQMPANVVPEAYSGKQYFLAITPEDGSAADDWLISPEVVPGSTVSFRLNILSEAYGMEQIDLLWSADGKDFTLLQTYSQTKMGWNPLEATLPAEARYFAFHYRCADIFGVCLDDIRFSPVADAEIDSYNVYRNGAKIADSVKTTSFFHDRAVNDDRYQVSVVTKSGSELTEHPLSNTYVAKGIVSVTDAVAGGSVVANANEIVITGFEGKTAAVYAADGKCIAKVGNLSSAEHISVANGVYLVTVDGQIFKVAVK